MSNFTKIIFGLGVAVAAILPTTPTFAAQPVTAADLTVVAEAAPGATASSPESYYRFGRSYYSYYRTYYRPTYRPGYRPHYSPHYRPYYRPHYRPYYRH